MLIGFNFSYSENCFVVFYLSFHSILAQDATASSSGSLRCDRGMEGRQRGKMVHESHAFGRLTETFACRFSPRRTGKTF